MIASLAHIIPHRLRYAQMIDFISLNLFEAIKNVLSSDVCHQKLFSKLAPESQLTVYYIQLAMRMENAETEESRRKENRISALCQLLHSFLLNLR